MPDYLAGAIYESAANAQRVMTVDQSGAYVAGGGGGGGGGDASAANQTSQLAQETATAAALGATADAAVTTNTTGTISGKLRGLVKLMVDLIAKTPALGTAGSAAVDVITVQGIASGTAQAVSGTVTANAGTGTMAVSGPLTDTQIRATALPVSGTVTANAGTGTLAVSAAALPLPSGAATSAKQPALGTAGSAATDVLSVQGIASGTALKTDGSATTQPVSGTVTANAGTGTLAVSAAALPLPSGAATAAKQPALGTAGSASADVITVQGIASGTAQPVTAGGYTTVITTTLTRVADTNILAANDAINTATSGATTLAIAGAARVSGGSGYITYVRFATDQAANVSAYRLHFYNAAPAVTVQDNAPQSILATDESKHIGSVDIPAVARVGTTGIPYAQATLTPIPFVAAATAIYCAVETVTGFTPASAQVFYITVGLEQN